MADGKWSGTPVEASASYPGIDIGYQSRPRGYTVNAVKVPSVTTIIGVLNKPGLPHYAARVSLEGAYKLLRRRGYQLPGDVTAFKADIKKYGLDHVSVTRQAADRGVDVHSVLENWIEQRQIPNAADYPEDRRGYIRALSKFLMEHNPEWRASEQLVGSATHGFAGRLDSVAILPVEGKGHCMVDLKTSKAVYPGSHFPQLIGYEIARRECGLEPTDHQAILRLGADGTYELAWSDAVPEDFLCLLAAYKSQQRWEKKR